ncbi:MAG: hypothetical protein ACRCUP_06770 [Mycoplasmatales bacterium]
MFKNILIAISSVMSLFYYGYSAKILLNYVVKVELGLFFVEPTFIVTLGLNFLHLFVGFLALIFSLIGLFAQKKKYILIATFLYVISMLLFVVTGFLQLVATILCGASYLFWKSAEEQKRRMVDNSLQIEWNKREN